MKKILTSLAIVVGLGAVIGGGATIAFLSDTETSTGNTFTAGAIDLEIDNDSYYNGNRCTDVGDNVWEWQGNAVYPVPGTTCATSFGPSNLDGLFFFDFNDLKPDDEGEDTISIHVGTNDAWVCMDLTLTSNDDISSNEPELETGDDLEDAGNAFDGELAEGIEFFWWADDGDNVYEQGENQITNGVVTLANLDSTFPVALADSQNNVWGPPGPVPGNETVYIAKAWCLGTLTLDSVPAGQGVNPSVDPGVNCDGTSIGNEYQTDGAELNIIFSAVQSRNNGGFLCNPVQEPLPILTVNKILTVSSPGIDVSDFELHINGPGGDQIVTDEIPVANLPVGNYTVSEIVVGDVGGATFTTVFGGACDAAGNVTLNLGDNVVCTITNTEILFQ